MKTPKDKKTIADFGEQWTRYQDNSGFYGSVGLLADYLEPLFPIEEVNGLRVADIGSGSGRIVAMLLQAGAEHVVAVEPSDAFHVLASNTSDVASKVTLIHAPGDQLKVEHPLDAVVSLGVLHHIEDPGPTVRAAHAALRPGGK
ncbi:bifunctional 2-polyprenyl-6-hydroxyphenol methylase/3-demethylubiquinol 3-O-methyltransferase UbiG [Devosia sp.]|uniref:class I SAM-dependent methyltransferase n=1 Tax=Devosia sp. TaxID=1871048 RepID=UPI0025CE8FEE|nr:class I SAM-dependent methyltransferase [Devosia sp.]MCR6636413.1 class I SAM-dependent methyltransferase [Devosia sp.]